VTDRTRSAPKKKKKSAHAGHAKNTNGKQRADELSIDQTMNALPHRILVIDLGGTKVKVLATHQTEIRKASSGPQFSPNMLVEAVTDLAQGWQFEAVSLGYPGRVGPAGPSSEAGNLAPGWVGFDFAAAFKVPVRVLNDAAMQALGSYEGGRMLFLGLGTGLGSTLISQNAIVPLELGRLRYSKTETLGEVLGREGLRRIGKRKWRAAVAAVVHEFLTAFEVEYVVLGGGNSKEIKDLPAGARLGHNQTAFRGGFRLWNLEDIQTLSPGEIPECPSPPSPADWRIL
jgi:polyphosphate glucokinase